jgi:hypothetical protein
MIMTEAEWLESKDLLLLIKHLRSAGWDRKLRLFACACARRVWDRLTVGNGQEAVELAERFADGGPPSRSWLPRTLLG